MPFPTVKSDPYKRGVRRVRSRCHLWSESYWRTLVLNGLLSIDDVRFRCQLADLVSFDFRDSELQIQSEEILSWSYVAYSTKDLL